MIQVDRSKYTRSNSHSDFVLLLHCVKEPNLWWPHDLCQVPVTIFELFYLEKESFL